MTRINTNVSSLVAQTTLQRSNDQLNTALTRLSTGLRINSGKDDPAGLIASESLKSDITSTQKGISNCQRANQMIATADSSLGQVSSLLNDIRGLVSEAANTGAMSADQLAANQLQIDASLEAINRVATTTQFQGQRLLDGSLDFLTEDVTSSKITNVAINQANFGSQPNIDITAQVTTQATKAALTYTGATITDNTVLQVGGSSGTQAFTFGAGSTITQMADAINLVSDSLGVTAVASTQQYHDETTGQVTLASYDTDGANNHAVKFTANNAGEALGNVKIRYVKNTSSASTTAAYVGGSGSTPGVLTVNLGTNQGTAAVITGAEATPGTGSDFFTLTASTNSDMYNGITLQVNSSDMGDVVSVPTWSYDYQQKKLTINGVNTHAGKLTTYAQIKTAFNATANAKIKALFTWADGTDYVGGTAVTGADLATNSAVTTAGVSAGAVVADAAAVIAAVNAVGVNAPVTASQGDTGGTAGLVSAMTESASYNTAIRNGSLLFQGPSDSPSIRFVNGGASQTLSVDTSQVANTYGTASGSYQASTTSFLTLTAKNSGTAYNGVSMKLTDTGAGTATTVVYDEKAKTLTVNGDFSGAGLTGTAIIDAINNDTVAGQYFTAAVTGTAGSTIAGTVGGSKTLMTLAGGDVTNRGVLIVNLGTDSSGTITTTASDLVTYLDPTNVASPNLTALGITVQNGVNGDGTASTGVGLLTASTVGSDLAMSDNATYTYAKSSGTTVSGHGVNASLVVSAKSDGGTYDGYQIKVAQDSSSGTTFSYSTLDRTITIHTADATTDASVAVTAYNALSDTDDFKQKFLIVANSSGDGTGHLATTDTGVLSGGATKNSDSGVALQGNYDAGYGDTGVQTLRVQANDYGSKNFVSVKSISGTFTMLDNTSTASTRAVGSDIVAQINGIKAVGDGLAASVKAAGFDMTLTFSDTGITAGQSTSFSITGGGAQFQMGPQVVSTQQSRMGIGSVNTTELGNDSVGWLYQLQSGQGMDITEDVGGAAKIVDTVISQITTLRGRLGAFQKTTLQTNIDSLNSTVQNLTDAQSSIADADFAAESANLTRAQVLVQSGTAVLGIANKNPENVLSLLR